MRRPFIIDLLLVVTVTLLVLGAVLGFFLPVPRVVGIAAVAGLTIVAAVSVLGRFVSREDKIRARQSRQTLEILNRSLPYLRTGLDAQTARAVCEIILAESDASAVAITDTDRSYHAGDAGRQSLRCRSPYLTLPPRGRRRWPQDGPTRYPRQ